jgi:hypothetical protein
MKINFHIASVYDDQGSVIAYKRFTNQEYFEHYCKITPGVKAIRFDEANINKEFNIALDIRRYFKKVFQTVINIPDSRYQIPLYSQGVVCLTTTKEGVVEDIQIMRPFSDSEKSFIFQELEQLQYGETI